MYCAVIYSLCYISPCITISLSPLSLTPCTSSKTTAIAFQAKTGDCTAAAYLVGDTIPVEEFASPSSVTTLPLDLHLWHLASFAGFTYWIRVCLRIKLGWHLWPGYLKTASGCLPSERAEVTMHADPFPPSTSRATKHIKGIVTGSLLLMTSLTSRLFISWSKNQRPLLLSSSSKLGLTTSLEWSWALWEMTRVGSTCLEGLRHSALTMASTDSTLSEITLSRMVWQRGPIGWCRKVRFPCSMSLGCLQLSGRGTGHFHSHQQKILYLSTPRLHTLWGLPWNKASPSALCLGCTAYVLIQRDKHPHGTHMEKCIFIGYPQDYKGWKFYNPVTKKVVISERIDFDEHYFMLQRHSVPHLPPLHLDILLELPPAPSFSQTS